MKQDLPDRLKLVWLDYLAAGLIVLLVVIEGLQTINRIGPCWDEPVYFHYAKNYVEWFRHIGSKGNFSGTVLERTFNISQFTNCSPALAQLLGAAGYALLKDQLGEFAAFRAYAPFLFGLLLSIIYLAAARQWERTAGVASVVTLFFMPRFFAEGHIGATEMTLCFFWVTTTLLFAGSLKNKRLAPLAGVCYGLAMSVKFTGFLLPAPLFLWALVFHRRRMAFPFLCLLIIGPLVFIALAPSMWRSPVAGFFQFLKMSLSRQHTTQNPTLFLGRYYTFSAPFYYAPFMVLVVTPAVSFLLFALGFIRALLGKLKDQLALAAIIHLCFFMALMAMPYAPTYDGVRLFIPAFVFIALLAGYGFAGLIDRLSSRSGKIIGFIVPPAALAVLVLVSARPLLKVYPYGLEYYNELIGGPSGARKVGMETTYWWTVLDKDALAKINDKLPQGASLVCWPNTAHICEFNQELGWLRKDIRVINTSDFQYLLLLSRPYPGYQPLFQDLSKKAGIPQDSFQPILQHDLDTVPLWTLYKMQ
jgi:4-amino-4-deoxy-L-arabinose transferase-like glycosyltransferase